MIFQGTLNLLHCLTVLLNISNNNNNICFSPPVAAMQAYVDAGLTTFDMADIYGPAEEIFGQFNSQVHT